MSITAITEFLGCEPIEEGVIEPDRNKSYYYKSEKLLYALHVNVEEKTFSVSGDFEQPFGFSSLFEVYVEWDSINIETEPECYGDQQILVCRKDYASSPDHKTLMIMKWPNGELSIWPSMSMCNDVKKN